MRLNSIDPKYTPHKQYRLWHISRSNSFCSSHSRDIMTNSVFHLFCSHLLWFQTRTLWLQHTNIVRLEIGAHPSSGSWPAVWAMHRSGDSSGVTHCCAKLFTNGGLVTWRRYRFLFFPGSSTRWQMKTQRCVKTTWRWRWHGRLTQNIKTKPTNEHAGK